MLGVPYGASQTVVLEAYRRLSKLHHPDREGGSDERFVEIQQAYETLRARPAPDASLEDRLAALEQELRESAKRGADARRARRRGRARRQRPRRRTRWPLVPA